MKKHSHLSKGILTVIFLLFTSTFFSQRDMFTAETSYDIINKGVKFHDEKEYDKAIATCKKALEINPNYELAKNNLALAQKNKAGAADAEAKVKANPTAENYLELSLTYYNQGQYEKCIEACNNALKLKPDYADAYCNIGAAYNQLKQWDKAIEALQKALQIDPDHKLAKGNLNWALDEKAKSR